HDWKSLSGLPMEAAVTRKMMESSGEVSPMPMEAKIRTIIVDDEAPARGRLRQLLKQESDIAIVAECTNGNQAVEAMHREQPDLAFLDVQMPRLNGVQVCQSILATNTPLPIVIFVTAYDSYALKAFEVHAVDYLLKPFDYERFARALRHARALLNHRKQQEVGSRLAAVLEEIAPGFKKPDRLVFKENGKIVFVQAENVDWVEADGNYVRVHVQGGSHYVRETLAGIESQLNPEQFMRISRSTLVNLDRVKELHPLFYGDYAVILKDGSRLSMSRNYRDRLESLVQRPRAGAK
ncbi:MAG TPA: LytTR family DNA-binding domain-containing protein, partial [Patescibacteria group bacterium]|nr:LytTR family DNA-binding domain-containing protein [Patescibacteria group bacterium]